MKGPPEKVRLSSTFLENLPATMVVGNSYPEQLLLREYGAVFVARGGAVPPDRVLFANAGEVEQFQGKLLTDRKRIGGFMLELQAAAMEAFCRAIAKANTRGLSLFPRGADSARRGYEETVELWKSRVEPALQHWTKFGSITFETADYIRSLAPSEQVSEILVLECEGVWFAKDLSKSIIYSVAPPGASQHLSMLAIDVAEFDDPQVRDILAEQGWFQTVVSDLPHFTYLGVPEPELVHLGLTRLTSGGRTFWIPDVKSE